MEVFGARRRAAGRMDIQPFFHGEKLRAREREGGGVELREKRISLLKMLSFYFSRKRRRSILV